MITKRRETQGPASLYALMLTVYSSRDSMATTLQIGLVCKTAVELADLQFKQNIDVDEPYDLVTKLVAANLTTENEVRAKSATDWAHARCTRAEEKGLLGITYLTGEKGNRRLKHYFLTEGGEREFNSLQAEFDLAYLKPTADVIGFGLIRRD
jgi:hypothetical protein